MWGGGYDGSGGNVPSQSFTRTTNGGSTWTAGTVPGTTGLDFSDIAATDANNAWAALVNNTVGNNSGYIYRTTNGGSTWTRQAATAFPAPTGYINGIHMFSTTSGVAVGDAVGGYFEIYTTANGGTTWTRVSAANVPASLTGEYGTQGSLRAVGTTLWFGTTSGRLLRSTNSGASWTVSATGLPQVDALAFGDALNGLVMDYNTSSTLRRTTDGGSTWTTVAYSGTLYNLALAAVPGTAGAYVSTGANPGGSSYTRDYGQSWATIDAGTSHFAVDFLSSTTGYAGGFVSSTFTGGVYRGSLPAASSYCVTGLGGASCDITQLAILGTTLNATTGTCPGSSTNNYSAYAASGSNTASLTLGATYTASVTTNANDIVSLWLDANQDGVFAASEWVQLSTSTTIGVAATASFTVPAGATPGTTRLRVRTRTATNPNAGTDACTSFGSGETRDYLVTLVNATVANDNCASASTLGVNATCVGTTGSTAGAAPSTAGTTSCGSSNGNDVWYRIAVPAGMTTLNVQTSAGTTAPQLTDTVLELYRGSCGSLVSAGCNDDIVTGNNFSLVTAAVTPGETIYARVLPYQITTDGSFQICAYGVFSAGNSTDPSPYCQAPSSVGCGAGNITNVTLASTTLNNSSTCTTNALSYPYYNYPATGSSTGTVQAGTSYTLSVTTDASCIISAWADWNRNAVFDASEWVQVTTASTVNTAASILLAVPSTTTAGTVRLRIRSRSAGSANGSTDACSTFASGEAEDYTLTVNASAVNTTSPSPYCAAASSVGCGNGNITNVTLTGTTLNNTSDCTLNVAGYPYYNYPAASATTGAVQAGSTYALSVTTDVSSIVSAWVDWNRNSVFDASEWVQVTTASVGAVPATVNLTVPAATTAGTVRLRVRSRAAGSANASTDACTVFASGEAEDYTLTVTTCPVLTAPTTTSASRCGAGTLTLQASGAPTGGSYRWYTTATGGTALAGVTGSSYSPSLSATTTYYVSVVSSAGCESARTAVTGTIGTNPVANAGSNRGVCPGVATQLGTAAVAGTTYSWTPTTGLSSPNVAQPTATLLASGTYTYTLTATLGSCTATSTVTVTVNPGAAAQPGPAVRFCSGGSAQLGTAAVAGVTYSWSPAAGLNNPNIAQPTVALTTSSPTPVSTTYTLTASSGSCVSTATVQVTVSPLTTAAFSYSAARYCLNGPAPTPTVTGTPGGTFTAPAGLSIEASTGTVSLNTSTPGTYLVTYNAGDDCPSTATFSLTIVAAPTASITPSGATTFCQGGSVTLTAPAGGTYQWSNNATSQAITVNASGNYTVTVSAGGCSATSAATTVSVNATPPTPTVSQAGNVLTSSASTGNQWYLNGNPIAGATANVYTIFGPGTYTVVVSGGNGCSSAASAAVVIAATAGPAPGTSLSIAPNPVTDGRLTVQLSGYTQAVELALLDALGRVVLTQAVARPTGPNATQHLSLTHLATGVYVLRATTAGGVDTRRVLVK